MKINNNISFKKIYLSLLFAISVMLMTLFAYNSKTIEAQTYNGKVEFWFELDNKKSIDTKAEFDQLVKKGIVRFKLYAKSLTSQDTLMAGFQYKMDPESLKIFPKITRAKSFEMPAPDDEEVMEPVWNVEPTGGDTIGILPISTEDFYIKPTKTEIATITIQYNQDSAPQSFELKFNYYDVGYTPTDKYKPEDAVFKPFVVGVSSTEENANLKSLSVKGKSQVEYITSLQEQNNITISYADSKEKLTVVGTPVKPGAQVAVTDTNSLPYQTGNQITVKVTDGSTVKNYTVTLTVTQGKTENNLKTLTTNKGTLEPTFSPDQTTYTLNLPYATTNVTLNASIDQTTGATLDNSEISIPNLSLGQTTKTFKVTSETGAEKTYTININRANASNDNSINKLEVNNQVVSPSGDRYETTLEENVSNFNFKITLNDANAKIEYKEQGQLSFSPLRNLIQSPNFGLNKNETKTFEIKITAEDGNTSKTYTLVVKRKASSNKELQSVMVQEDTISKILNFQNQKYEYVISNPKLEFITITAVGKENATVQILKDSVVVPNGKVLLNTLTNPGKHVFKIKVTAEDLTTKEYDLEIIKKSTENSLVSVEVKDKDNGYEKVIDLSNFETSASNTYRYQFDYKYSNLFVVFTSSEKSTISANSGPSMNSNKNVMQGDLSFNSNNLQTLTLNFSITSESGDVNDFTFHFVRKAADTENRIETLTVNSEPVKGFNSDKLSGYDTIIVPGDTTSVIVEATLKSNLSKVTYNDQTSQQITLQRGVLRTIFIRVTSEAKQTKEYIIQVIAANENNEITNIELENLTLNFDKSTYEYNLEVPASFPSTKVKVTTPEGSNSTIFGQGDWILNIGPNKREVYAVSESKKEGQKYVINITKKEAKTNSLLETLTISNESKNFTLTPEFNKTHLNYTLRVDDIYEFVNVQATVNPAENSKIISGLGRIPLISGQEKVVTIVVEAENKQTTSYSITVKRANDNNKFTSVVINGSSHLLSEFGVSKTLNLPNISHKVKSYDVQFNLEDPKSKVQSNLNSTGKWEFTDGSNELTFKVISQAGTVGETYKVVLTREVAKTNNKLQTLSVKNGMEELIKDFSPEKNNYTIRIDRSVSSVLINATVDSNNDSTIKQGQLGTKATLQTTNNFVVTVVAEDGSTNDYTIEIIKKNDSNKILNIEFQGYTLSPNFTEGNLTYQLPNIPYSVKEILITVTKEDEHALLYINKKPVLSPNLYQLVDGQNIVKIKLVSEFGTEGSEYTITFNREIAKTNNELQTLEVISKGENLLKDENTFNKDKISYELRVDNNVDTIEIKATVNPTDYSKITGDIGHKPLVKHPGTNTFRVKVTAENGEAKEYLIVVKRANDNNKITNIKIDGNPIQGFNPSTLRYEIPAFDYLKNDVNIEVELEDSSAVVSNAGNISLIDGKKEVQIFATSEAGTKGQVYTIVLERTAAYKDNTLKNLTVTKVAGEKLPFVEGEYQKNNLNYTVQLPDDSDVTEININVEVNDQRQKISGKYNKQTLNITPEGTLNQTFNITVTPEVGNPLTYSVTVLKKSNLNNDASIKSVQLTDISGKNYLTFDSLNANQLPVEIPYKISSLTLTVVTNDPTARVVGAEVYQIEAGNPKKIQFQVTAQDGKTKSLLYVINVTRANASNDSFLKKLEVLKDGENLLKNENLFSKEKFEYNLKLDRTHTLVTVNYEKNNENQIVTGDVNQVTLRPGSQSLRIFVTAEDNSQKVYTININVVNSEIEVTNLEVVGHTLNFDKETKTYDLGEVNQDVKQIEIRANISDTFGKLEGIGTKVLNDGLNTFTVKATAEDGIKFVEYVININRKKADNNNYLSTLVVKNGHEIIPFKDGEQFNKLVTNYSIILEKGSKLTHVTVEATTESPKARIDRVSDRYELNFSETNLTKHIIIKVIAENGNVNSYNIIITKDNTPVYSADTSITEVKFIGVNKEYVLNFKPNQQVQDEVIVEYADNPIYLSVTAAPKATVSGIKQYTIEANNHIIVKFQVTAEDGVTKSLEYQVKVSRKQASDEKTPSNFYVLLGDERKDIDVNQRKHTFYIKNNINEITIHLDKPVLSTVSGTGRFEITETEQTFIVLIIAENQTATSYEIKTIKKSDDNTIKSILVNEIEKFGAFDSSKTLTLDNVLYEVESINILATPSHERATIEGNGVKKLEVGLNTFKVYAVSELGTKGLEYTINITRNQADNDSKLRELKVYDNTTTTLLQLSPEFNPDQKVYNIDLTGTDTNEIKVEAVANSLKAKVTGNKIYLLKSGEGAVTQIFEVTVTAEDKTQTTYEIKVTKNIDPRDDVTIESISLIGGDGVNYLDSNNARNPKQLFTVGNKQYNILVPFDLRNVNLTIINNNGASIIGAGNHVLNDNPNQTEIRFRLTSNSGKKQSEEYVITITKEEPSNDNTLRQLLVNDILIEGFEPNRLNYTLIVEYEKVDKLNIKATPNNPKAQVIGDLGDVTLSQGDNTINIQVRAQNNEIKTYTITVKRLSSNNEITNIVVENYPFDVPFSKNIYEYKLQVSYDVKNVNIIASHHRDSIVTGDGIKTLNEGKNTFVIFATSQSGVKGLEYTVEITREEVDKDSTLKNLTVLNNLDNQALSYSPEFNPSILSYNIIIPKTSPITSLTINAEANSKKAIVGGTGYKVLKAEVDGDYNQVFEITVRAQDGSTTTYTVFVYRKEVTLSEDITINELSLVGSDLVNYLGTDSQAKNNFVLATHEYNITVPYNVLSLTLDVKTKLANVIGAGTKTFNEENKIVFEFSVISQSGNTQSEKYIINVTREQAITSNLLKELKIDGKLVKDFDPEKADYVINIPTSKNNTINIEAIAQEESAVVSGDLGINKLNQGINIFKVLVKAQNGESKVYTITVNYFDSNSLLKDLKVLNNENNTEFAFDFDPLNSRYTVKVRTGVEAVRVTGEAENIKSKVIGFGTYQLDEQGKANIIITVIAEDNNSESKYIINVKRDDSISGNNRLKSLEILGQKIDFSPKVKKYGNISVDENTTKLEIKAVPEDSNAKVNIIGNDDFRLGKNLVLVEVVAENGESNFYQIEVTKDSETRNLHFIILISLVILWVLLLVANHYVISRRKRALKNNKN